MKPFYTFSDSECKLLFAILSLIEGNPFLDYSSFMMHISNFIENNKVPRFFQEICANIRIERESGISNIHVLRNCPIDPEIPDLDFENPVKDKYLKKHTFIGEAFLAFFAKLTKTPLLAYNSRNNGDFFTDVIAINRYSGMQTGFSDSELVYHNDRTAHVVRADFIALLGLRCPQDDLIYTGFIDGRNLLVYLSEEEQKILRKPYFITPFDIFSRDTNNRQIISEKHSILERYYSFRYLDGTTSVAIGTPEEAKDAFIAMKNALTKAERVRHRILTGDLLIFANQDGLHNREKIEINDPENARSRWLLKTYAFRDQIAAGHHSHRWVDGIYGRVAD